MVHSAPLCHHRHNLATPPPLKIVICHNLMTVIKLCHPLLPLYRILVTINCPKVSHKNFVYYFSLFRWELVTFCP